MHFKSAGALGYIVSETKVSELRGLLSKSCRLVRLTLHQKWATLIFSAPMTLLHINYKCSFSVGLPAA